MNNLSHKVLLTHVAERLATASATTDHLLLTRWRVLGLAQYLAGAPGGEAEELTVEALGVYIREGPGKPTDVALQRARNSVSTATSTMTGSVLPVINSEVGENVFSQMKEYRKLGNAAIQHAIEVLPTLQERLRKSPAGALLSGLQYRLELVAAVAGDGDRPDNQRLQAASAILYLNEIHDAIPDTLGYIGLLDDDFALRVVLDEVGGYTEDEKFHWAERISALWEDLPFLQGVRLRHKEGPVATTWLDRINSYIAYSHVLGGVEAPLVLVQPSVACSPLHSIVSLIGLMVLEALTSSQDQIKLLREGQTYEIDGKFRVRYGGVMAGPPAPGWLRLKFRDATICRPPTIADRMVAVADCGLSLTKTFGSVIQDDTEPIQRFFDWHEAIGTASVTSRVLLVTSRQRAEVLLGGGKSNGVSLLDDRLVGFAGLTPSPDVLRTALVLVVPTLQVARELVQEGIAAHAVLVDGYERLRRGRHDLPFLQERSSPPSVIVWSFIGYYPDKPPSWLSVSRQLEVASDDLATILELDGDSGDAMAPAQESLWEAATATGVEQVRAAWAGDEEIVLTTIKEFQQVIQACEELQDYWKYHLFSSAATLRSLVSATAGYWADIQEFVRGWDVAFHEQWGELRLRAAERLVLIAEAHQRIISAVSKVTSERNSKADALIAFCNKEQGRDWCVVCDRPEQVRITSRLAQLDSLKLKPVLLRDLVVCQKCVVIGWQNMSFARKLRAHTPRRLVALADDREWQKWKLLEIHSRRSNGESLLEAVGHRPRPSIPLSERPDEVLLDDEPNWWKSGETLNDESEHRVPCVFIWLADEPRGKVLARDNRVLVKTADQAHEKAAHRIVPEDQVILGPGSRRWSPADEFTQAVVAAVEASHPELVRNAREWRVALCDLQASRKWTLEELQAQLTDVGVHRETQTLKGWLQVDQAAPIRPKHFQRELSLIWQLVANHTELTSNEVVEACKYLHSLRYASGRALLKLWKGGTIDLGVEKISLEKLVDQLRQQVQVHVVDAISYGMVPDSMLGWWVTPELASSFQIEQDIFIPNSV